MKIRALFARWEEDDVPSIVLAVDEYCDERNPAYWPEESRDA